MSTPLISICIPIYNGEQYLVECMESVLKQGIDDCEILIVDDGSTDNSIKIIENYQQKNSKIKLHINEKNLGLVGNWNRCLELAKGKWIKFVFQDDLLADNCIRIMLDAAGNNSFVVCDREFIFDNLVSEEMKSYFSNTLLRLNSIVKSNEKTFISSKFISDITAKHVYLNYIGEPTAVLFKKSLVSEVGIFNANLFQICDLEYWLRIATAKGLVFVPEKLISFRVHANSTTSRNLTGNKNFRANYFDVLILTHDLLYSSAFTFFRNSISNFQKLRLKLFLKLKIHETTIAFDSNTSVEPHLFEELLTAYPKLGNFIPASVSTKILYQLLLLKRKLF